ncbi:hypothetical protein JQV55_17930 [Sulfitobacter geojensis]|uniref:Uncharacterized protein n=2 Tax=Sulfitobacter geojensis TaxID=1342299 RepID=A0AAE3B7N1_9RHOB|nr:hypothetical protein [Sulfitobacter geojensis]MBM1691161.1 hypothetical protein [Sulfitobacter geojensis]MBM1695227.1 hypothetical protein [Sulfitobacter geojensis]MBM1707327.1 hypothetical protein [Sulfitobacter geojensis]MBM1711477.1 hypothetical protein [Sulfitobacter geojensis]MBM1715452.1 hypothetical protein [Sulfitobacter geojensis]
MAERNLIPSLESIPDVCPERPNEPNWMQNIALRDAYHRVLVQDIYRAQNMERIVETGSCDCATRFPTWDTAEGAFRENHADADRAEMLQASDTYNRLANDLRSQAKAICEAAGNW